MPNRRLLLVSALLLAPHILAAQGSPPKAPAKPGKPADTVATFARHLFAPELIMRHQAQLKLTDAQRSAILQEIRNLQEIATPLQWKISEESGKLSELLSREPAPREGDVIAQADRLMSEEAALKRAQLQMLFRVRTLLTAEQRAVLTSLRERD